MSRRRIESGYLFASWIALFPITCWRPLVTYWRVTLTPEGHGTASFEFSGNPFVLALWILGPPILFTVLWLAARRSEKTSTG
jgi:hypothetical protein